MSGKRKTNDSYNYVLVFDCVHITLCNNSTSREETIIRIRMILGINLNLKLTDLSTIFLGAVNTLCDPIKGEILHLNIMYL